MREHHEKADNVVIWSTEKDSRITFTFELFPHDGGLIWYDSQNDCISSQLAEEKQSCMSVSRALL